MNFLGAVWFSALLLALHGDTTAKILDVSEHVSKLAEANLHFSVNLYKKLIEDSSVENIMFSPISVSAAMAMAHLGAKGDTAKQIDDAFMFSKIEEGKFHSAFGELHGFMLDKSSDNVTVKSSNRVFANDQLSLQQDYKNALTVYGAQVDSLNFANKPEAAEESINQWIKDATDGKITNMLSKGSINADTALLIANAVYFRADWHAKFSETQTEHRNFYVSHYKVVKTPFMFQRSQFKYAYVDSLSLQVLELPYAGQEFSMIILLPENFHLEAVEEQLTPENLTSWLSMLDYKSVDLTLPKFKLEETLHLHKILPKLGVVDVFDSAKSDLSAIATGQDLQIDQVLHKAVLEVDEKGSVAAAATTARVVRRSLEIRQHFVCDHPFFWAIRHRNSGLILYMGRLARPAGAVVDHEEL